jgi:GT2 family glycosyltransferase
VRYRLRDEPKVSIVIPTKNNHELLRTCLDSIAERTTYANYELLVIDNGSTEPATLAVLADLRAPARVIRHDVPFNWSAINNVGAARTDGEFLLFLNDDVEVLEPGWIGAMLEHAQHPEVGAVGASLVYPNGMIQHAGVIVGAGSAAGHAFNGMHPAVGPYKGYNRVIRNYSAVTGACMMTARSAFDAVGGFDERLRIAYGDVDYCLRLRARGLSIVYTPYAELIHKESATRGRIHPVRDDDAFRARWPELVARGDPFYNVNFSRRDPHHRLRLA